MLISAPAKQVPLLLAGAVALSIPFAGVAQALTLLDQIGTGKEQGRYASQIFEPAFSAFDVAYLDDFKVTSPVTLNLVEAVFLGSDFFSPEDYLSVQQWRVEVYSSVKTAAASKNLEGDAGRQPVSPGLVTLSPLDGGNSSTKKLVSIPVRINLFTPGDYWISVIPVLNFLPDPTQPNNTKQLFVLGSTDPGFPGDHNSVQVNPGRGLVAPVPPPFVDGIREGIPANAAYRVQGEVIPTPALLPGLIGLGIGMWRKRKQQRSSE